jgi:hypothetical protein
VPCIEHGSLDDEAHRAFLQNIAACAQRYVMGPDEATLQPYLTKEASAPPVPEPSMLGFFGGEMAREFEMVYFNTVTALSSPPANANSKVGVDYLKNLTADEEAVPPSGPESGAGD